mgnify:CR=1 FL=1
MKMNNVKKVVSIFAIILMLISMMYVASFAENVNTTITQGSLTVSVDNAVEGLYFEGHNVKSNATNGYYPFSFSLIFSDRSKVVGRPIVKETNENGATVQNGFHWAYKQNADGTFVTDEDGNYVEDPNTRYGLVTLPIGKSSVVEITVKKNENTNEILKLYCGVPSGGTTNSGASLFACLPAPGQFTNEGIGAGGWGDPFDSNGALKANSQTGISLGFFGGYAVYKFDNPIADNPANKYGADFIVYGNAFWNNSEPGCIQVSQDGVKWYDIAGSKYYDSDTIKNASITYTNPNPAEDAAVHSPGTAGSLAPVNYTGTRSGTITTNNFHSHSWFPLNANYFVARNGNATALDKVASLSFASRTLTNGVTNTLTLEGTMLGGISSTNITDKIGFGYCDAHPNKELGGTIAYNPYQQFANQNDYNTKTAGTSGGDPIDISWAVDSNGQPANLGSIRYVRVYTGAAAMNGIFGEISTEVCGIAPCTGTTTQAPTSGDALTITVVDGYGNEYTDIPTTNGGISLVPVDNLENNIVVSVSGAENVYINGKHVSSQATIEYRGEDEQFIQIIAQSGDGSPYITYLRVQSNS